MTPQEARKIITAAKKRGAVFSEVDYGDDYIIAKMEHGEEKATIRIILEGCPPEHFKELIDWQMEAWK